jgi:hypothetical protein
MTLIVTINGPETIWMLADRRLSQNGKTVRDNARKIMVLNTNDAVALIGYAGLGATSNGTEPADWMSAVLRGRNLPLEQSLRVLEQAAVRELPPHMNGVPMHAIMVPAFVGRVARLYSIQLLLGSNALTYRLANHASLRPVPRPPRIMVGGSGAAHLLKDVAGARTLLRIVRACDRLKVPAIAVADHLAKINFRVHKIENTVGPDCIVLWRHRPGTAHKDNSGQQCYKGVSRHADNLTLPIISSGMDVTAFDAVMLPHVMDMFRAFQAGNQSAQLDKDAINRELANLPDAPDEKLR